VVASGEGGEVTMEVSTRASNRDSILDVEAMVVAALHLIVAAVDSMATILMAQETAAPTSMEGVGPMGWIEVTGDIGGEVGGQCLP
jgi:hypothetical protein